jgi:hypothetical protein
MKLFSKYPKFTCQSNGWRVVSPLALPINSIVEVMKKDGGIATVRITGLDGKFYTFVNITTTKKRHLV